MSGGGHMTLIGTLRNGLGGEAPVPSWMASARAAISVTNAVAWQRRRFERYDPHR